MTWDWKSSALKMLCHRHSEAHGWRLEDQLLRARAIESWPDSHRGALFVRFHDHVMWAFTPQLDLEAAFRASPATSRQPEKRIIEAAGWYLGYAKMDVRSDVMYRAE